MRRENSNPIEFEAEFEAMENRDGNLNTIQFLNHLSAQLFVLCYQRL